MKPHTKTEIGNPDLIRTTEEFVLTLQLRGDANPWSNRIEQKRVRREKRNKKNCRFDSLEE